MKFLNWKTAKISTVLLLISTTSLALNPSLPSEAREIRKQNQTNSIVVAQNSTQKSSFTAVGKQQKTTGTVELVKENGKKYLVFSSDFSTPDGPDVFLVLHKDKQVKTQIEEKDYINIAKLNKFSGAQRYLVPDDVDLKDFQSIGIWCREFNVTFAFAPLKTK